MKVNSGTILIGFFAILCGLVGVHLYRSAIKPKPVAQPVQPKAAPAPRKSVVPMVSRNLVPGQKITLDDVALVQMTVEQRKRQGLKKAYMTNPDQIIGKTVRNALRRGDTFDTRDFYPIGTGPGISHRVKPGFRALTVALTPANALIGFAGAGQKVDVLFHYGTSGGHGGRTQQSAKDIVARMPGRSRNRSSYGGYGSAKLVGATSTIAQDVEILALNNTTTEAATANGVASQIVMVTLAVRPRDAEALRVARGHGELSLTLRGPTDKSVAIMPMPSTVNDLINIQEPTVNEMEIFRGGSVSRLQFVNNPDAVIKPRRMELPQLRIHLPPGSIPDVEIQSPQDSELVSPGQKGPVLESANQGQVKADQVSDVEILDDTQMQLHNGAQYSVPPNPNEQKEMLEPDSQTALHPSLPGVRFADDPYGLNRKHQAGMPSSVMSSGRRDYREKFRGPANTYHADRSASPERR